MGTPNPGALTPGSAEHQLGNGAEGAKIVLSSWAKAEDLILFPDPGLKARAIGRVQIPKIQLPTFNNCPRRQPSHIQEGFIPLDIEPLTFENCPRRQPSHIQEGFIPLDIEPLTFENCPRLQPSHIQEGFIPLDIQPLIFNNCPGLQPGEREIQKISSGFSPIIFRLLLTDPSPVSTIQTVWLYCEKSPSNPP